MNNYMYLVPIAAVIALLFAAYLAGKVGKQDAGTDRMKEIAGAIAEGARAFLMAEYKILVIFCSSAFCTDRIWYQLGNSSMLCNWSTFLNSCRILWYDSRYKSERKNC